jgi:TonB family protein
MNLRLLAVSATAAFCVVPIVRADIWTRYQPEGCTISIELPSPPTKVVDAGALANPEGAMSSSVRYRCNYNDSSVTLFEAILMRDNPEVRAEISSGFCDGVALDLKGTGGAALNRTISQTTFLGQPAEKFRFLIDRGEANLSVIGYVFYEQGKMHAVCGIYDPKNQGSLETVKRMFESIQLAGKGSAAEGKVTPTAIKFSEDMPAGSLANTPGPAIADTKIDVPAPDAIAKASAVLTGSATKKVAPVYPKTARDWRISGLVAVEVTIDEKGNVLKATAVSGDPLLRPAAIEAARQWKFKPSLLGGKPVKVTGAIMFNFTL